MCNSKEKQIETIRTLIALAVTAKGEKGVDCNAPKMMNLSYPVKVSPCTKVTAVGAAFDDMVNRAYVTYKLKTKKGTEWTQIGTPCRFKASPKKLLKILLALDMKVQ